jgi:hypothetical protein
MLMPDDSLQPNDVAQESKASSDLQEYRRELSLHVRRTLYKRAPNFVIAILGVISARYSWDHWKLSLGEWHSIGENVFCIVGGILCFYLLYNTFMVMLGMASLNSESLVMRNRVYRAVVFLAFILAGLRVGGGFVHLCYAGSRWLETAAFVGTPVFAGAIVLFVKRRWLGLFLATLVILAVWLFQRPYLDWAHGN